MILEDYALLVDLLLVSLITFLFEDFLRDPEALKELVFECLLIDEFLDNKSLESINQIFALQEINE